MGWGDFGPKELHFGAESTEKRRKFWEKLAKMTHFCAVAADNFEKLPYFSKNSHNFVKVENFYCLTMRKMTKEVEKDTLYRLFLEIC